MKGKILIAVPTFENIKPECFKSIYNLINPKDYLLYFDYVIKRSARKSSNGSAIKNIPAFEVFKKMILPLPPLQEQKRIVEKVKYLDNICNVL